MMKKKIYIFGNFGYQKNNLNGQTMRTRTIYNIVDKYTSSNRHQLRFTDSSKGTNIIMKFVNFLRGFINCLDSNIVILLPAQRAIRFVTPLIYFINTISKKDIHFVAIGGWLIDFLNTNNKYVKYFKRFRFIYVQTESLKKKLEELNLNNVIHLPNFRVYKETNTLIQEVNDIKKIVLFSRIIKEKGIEIAVSAINEINKKRNLNIELSIYGPIGGEFEQQFRKTLDFNKNVVYRGIIEPDNILNELSQYDFMIFPTYYEGEGFPGTILDAMTAGIPVIASDWKYNSEVLVDGKTGLLFENKSIGDLINKLNIFIDNPELVNKMKKNCILESKKYHHSYISNILIDKL
ncbi:glycosyltransferase family 4 protein [Metabacillus indicus]|uniref:glycosyltransferase family 4 protein n=1 Tax=Metabacillus indicus TaxID=246786 RepID=UPI002A07936A|nr:glycosyltransferase family 4 protein [Metabacillus indicus]MDX8289016.1 glycosyltransferase family 4 protein [Metabacillus indicus]